MIDSVSQEWVNHHGETFRVDANKVFNYGVWSVQARTYTFREREWKLIGSVSYFLTTPSEENMKDVLEIELTHLRRSHIYCAE